MEDYSRYSSRLDSNNSDDDRYKHAIRLAINEFLLNGTVRIFPSGEIEVTILKRYPETIGSLLIPPGSSHDEIYQLTKSFLLNNELPDYCKFGYELCNSLVNVKDDIFFTNWKHVVWLEAPSIQGFLLNDSIMSMYLLKYDINNSVVRLFKAITSQKRRLVKEYNFIEEYDLFNNPSILVRQMIFDIYENGLEDADACPNYLINV